MKIGSKSTVALLSVFLAVIFLVGSESAAWAYLDPGSGSLILQIALGALVGFFATLKIYWNKIKAFFLPKKPGQSQPERKP